MSKCIVYVACRMTGRCRAEQVERAKWAIDYLAEFGLTGISPVISEGVPAIKGELHPASKEELLGNWTRDKILISRVAHVVLLDGADEGSVGMAREHGYNRYSLWKPTVVIWNQQRGHTVADFEDDLVAYNFLEAANFILKNFGTRRKRIAWRIRMLARCLPKWIINQIYAWR